jgi:hypothetical protein
MTKVVVVSNGRALLPRDPYSEDVIRTMSREDAMATISQPRGLKYHKFMMVMLHKVAQNHATLTTVGEVMHRLKMLSGMYDPIIIAGSPEDVAQKTLKAIPELVAEAVAAAPGADADEVRRIVKRTIAAEKERQQVAAPVPQVKPRMAYILKSIAFEKCDQTEFSEIMDRWRRLIKTELLPGLDDEGLINEIVETL